MIFTLSSHRAEHWWFFGHGREFDSDVRRGKFEDLYGPAHRLENDKSVRQHRKSLPMPDRPYLEDWLARCCEVVDKYRPQIVYFDWWIQRLSNSVSEWLRELRQEHLSRYGS